MTLNCVYITLCMHVCVYILCVCARSPPVICPSAPWAVYCDAVSLLFDGWQTITRRLILWLIICTISYRSTHTHTDTHCSRLSSQSFRQRTHKDTVMCLFDFSPSSFIVCCLCLRWSAVFLPWSSFKSPPVSIDLSSFKSTTRNLNSKVNTDTPLWPTWAKETISKKTVYFYRFPKWLSFFHLL